MIVYYSDCSGSFFENLEPLSSCLFENLHLDFDKISKANNYVKCPAFQEYIKNIFVVRARYDFVLNLNKENGTLNCPDYNQNTFDRTIVLRHIPSGLFSFLGERPIFFSEEDLEMEQLPPIFHNSMSRNVIIPAKFNIGKHFRPLECSIHCFESGQIKIKEGDPIFYVKFNTKEKIEFKKFLFKTEKFSQLITWFFEKRNFTKRILPLQWYYQHSIRKIILKEIKNNLID